MKSFVLKSFLSLIYVLLYFPIVILIVYSLNKAKFSLQWQGFSLHWYAELFSDRELWSSFLHSIILGLTASTIATGLGFLASVNLFLFHRAKQKRLQTLSLLLIIIPDVVLAVALLVFFNAIKLPLGFFSLLIAHISFCLPFVVLTINSRINSLDPNIYFSALDLGASHLKAITKILLPLLWSALLSAFLLCFTLSFDDVITSYFVAGSDFNILPLTIYSLVRAGVTPELNALCSITIIFSIILVIIAYRLAGKTP